MGNYIPSITIDQAKKIADKNAYEQLEAFIENKDVELLEQKYFEAECCWFFFRNRNIIGTPEQVLKWDVAYAISKKGELRLIADFWNEPDKLQEYLLVMSNHFKKMGL